MKKTASILLLIVVLLFASYLLKDKNSEENSQLISVLSIIEFQLDNLEGNWAGKGFSYLPDSSKMMVTSKFDFFYNEEKENYLTSLSVTGDEYEYSDYGILSKIPESDSIKWETRDHQEKLLTYVGQIQNDKLILDCQTDEYSYKLNLFFTEQTKVFMTIELYKEQIKIQWMEFSFEKQ